MKKIVLLASAVLVMTACKKNSEEVKVDETKMETPGDTLTGKDTVAVHKVIKTEAPEQPEAKEQPEQAEKPEAAEKPEKAEAKESFAVFGEKFTAAKVMNSADMLKKYKSMKAGDTAIVQFKSKVNEVCKKKGCWMSMALPGEQESFVNFKDYGFFVPKNADGSEAIVHGKAFIKVTPVAQLQHYAKDGGKSQEEIDKITEPKITYAFVADGVLMKE
jgi:hypothetical protein